MLWSTSTASVKRKAWWSAVLVPALCLCGVAAGGQELRVPDGVTAGTGASIATTGNGKATLYLIGPSSTEKREINLGEGVSLTPKQLISAGRYLAIVCADACQGAAFFVGPAQPASISFLVHPSRAPVGQPDLVSGAALTLDEFRNLVTATSTVKFELASGGKTLASHSVPTKFGAAWFRTSSGKAAGALQITAAVNDVSARRVVQQVASDPCNLRIKGQRTGRGIVVETEPVRDCSGNPVPDGTVVTFTARDNEGTDTVDAPIKKGVARAQMTASGPVVISAASGVVMGNELRIGGQ